MIKQIKIGGQPWMVEEFDSNETSFDGSCVNSSTKILIRRGLSRERLISVILHEITHALMCQSGQARILDNVEKEEGVCDAVANGFIQVLRDNPAILEMVRSGRRK